jgi:hypothetical protein
VNLIKDAVLPVIPENVKKPDNIYARNLVNFTCGWVEEMARLEINLGVQWAMGLRAGTPVDHATLAVSSGLKAGLDVVKDNIGDREVQPYAHMAIDAVQAMQYMLARVTGMVLSEEKASKLGRGKDFEEALRTRVNLRLYDQVLAPAFTYILNANGLLGENPSAFDNQVARERMVQHLGAKLMQGLMASWGGDHGPLGEMITDKNLLATLRANMDHLLVGGRDPKDTEFYSGTDLAREKVKHKLNRASLAATDGQAFYQMLSATFQQLTDKLRPPEPQDLEAGNPDHRVGRAIEMQSLEDPTREGLRQRRGEKVRALVTAQDERIAGARAYTSGRSDLNAGESSPTTNSITEASRAQREVVAKQERQLMGKHNNLPTDAEGALDLSRTPQGPLRSAVPQPVQIDYALRQRDAAGKRDTRGVNADLRRTDTHRAGVPVDQISRDVGTFSGKLQAGALREHLPMTRAAGMPEVVKKSRTKDSFLGRITNLVRRAAAPVLPSPIRPLNNDMKDRIDNSVRDYTVESQFFHYPLRWPVTGQPMVMKLAKKEIAPGVELAYNVLNKPGNIKGEKSKRVDPIEALYANIGCARAKKFPADLLRAVVTEAAYKNLDPANPQEADGVLQTGGSLGVMSEIFSASASAKVAAQFNLPISGFGAVHKSNSQRIDLVQETGVNIAAMTDLAQAEVILMPGAMFRVKHVDENAGKRPAAAGTTGVPPRDIGQVVYAESIDTYKMEQDYEAAVAYLGGAGGKAPAVGTLTVEPDTGQVLRFVRTPDKGDKVYDPATKTFSDHDSSKPMPNGALVFDSKTKNYFLGRPLEFANLAEQEALWRHPYAGRSAKRATKDAIHAAIVRGDPIVEHLDEAIKNLHHEHYRREGGFYDTVDDGHGTQVYSNPRAQAEADRTARTKEAAKAVAADHLSSGGFSQPLDDVGTEMLAWTTASYLRTPVKLMPVHGQTGLPAEGLSINETYDKVDMLKDPLKRKPPPAVTIGVGPDGYYAMRKVNDRFEPTHKITGQTEGKSAENFMQAFLRAGPLDKFHFNEQPPSEPGGTPTYKADSFAKHSASQLYGKLCGFAKTDYIVLQQALVERQERATARAGGTGTPPQQRKGSTSSTGSRESAAAGTSKGRYVPPPEASFDQWLEAEQAAKERVDASESEEDEIQFVIDHEPDPTGPNKGKSKA